MIPRFTPMPTACVQSFAPSLSRMFLTRLLLGGDCGDGQVAKAVEAINGGDPDIAFTILKEPGYVTA
jgi:hypothetical protein